jgi:hypothetical protein
MEAIEANTIACSGLMPLLHYCDKYNPKFSFPERLYPGTGSLSHSDPAEDDHEREHVKVPDPGRPCGAGRREVRSDSQEA